MRTLLTLTIFFLYQGAYSQDYYCQVDSPFRQTLVNECTTEDFEDDDTVCQVYAGVDSDGNAGGGAGPGDGGGQNQAQMLDELGGCFQGLGDYLFGGDFANDAGAGYKTTVKNLHQARNWVNTKVWGPVEGAWKTLIGKSNSDLYDERAREIQNFTAKREAEVTVIVENIGAYRKEWSPTSANIAPVRKNISTQDSEIDTDISNMEGEFGDFSVISQASITIPSKHHLIPLTATIYSVRKCIIPMSPSVFRHIRDLIRAKKEV